MRRGNKLGGQKSAVDISVFQSVKTAVGLFDGAVNSLGNGLVKPDIMLVFNKFKSFFPLGFYPAGNIKGAVGNGGLLGHAIFSLGGFENVPSAGHTRRTGKTVYNVAVDRGKLHLKPISRCRHS